MYDKSKIGQLQTKELFAEKETKNNLTENSCIYDSVWKYLQS